jgi:hypothetical protein
MMPAPLVRFLIGGVLLAVSCTAPCVALRAQSLADVAQAEAERRSAITQPSPIYTNKDLKPVRSPARPLPADESATPPQPRQQKGDSAERSSSTATPVEREDERGESWWRQRMAAARERVERSRLFADALQSRVNGLTADFAARDDPAARAAVRTDLDKALAELERVGGEISEQERALAELEEEARRAGVPPGWLR